MTDVRHSGYKAEMQNIVFSGTQVLDSLAIDEWTSLSDEIDNSATLWLFADFRVELGTAVFTGASSALELYLLPAINGSVYPDWVDDVTSEEQENVVHLVGSVTTSGASGAQDLALRSVELPPGKWKLGVRNKTGVALAASANIISFRPWQYSSA